jgi:NhaP-type Na+/H+ or K+/H+ antiporter
MNLESLTATLALIGIVILISSLLSGAVERTGLPQVAIFLLVGAALGPSGLGLIALSLDSPSLKVIATLGLVLVLFSDAISLDVGEVRLQRRLALAILGPGTLLPATLIAMAAWWLLGLSVPASAILGAALASTDPVLLRTLVRHPSMPAKARVALRLESGMNDVILLPIVVLSMLALGGGDSGGEVHLGSHVVGLFLLGPALGVAAGYIAITLLDQVRKKVGVRRDYESLYALGIAFTAYAAAEAVGGSGFLAAFAAGVTVAALDVELCDCFLDYGEASAEMFLLLTFVAFGSSLIWTGVEVADLRMVLFAIFALLVRTIVLLPVLSLAGVQGSDRWIIALSGPRGLSSLLLVLLPVFAGIAGSEQLFSVTCLVVLLSVGLHGGGIALYLQGRRVVGLTPRVAAAPASPTPSKVEGRRSEPKAEPKPVPALATKPVEEKITLDEVRALMEAGVPLALVDVRTERSYRDDDLQATGAIRLPPDDAVRLARERRLSQHATLVLYCA